MERKSLNIKYVMKELQLSSNAEDKAGIHKKEEDTLWKVIKGERNIFKRRIRTNQKLMYLYKIINFILNRTRLI